MDPRTKLNPDDIAVIVTEKAITLCALGVPLMVPSSSSIRYSRVLRLISEGNLSDAYFAADASIPEWAVAAYSLTLEGVEVEIRDKQLFINGVQQPPSLIHYVEDLMSKGIDIDRLLKFLARLEQNPSYTARETLLNWLKGHSLPITSDGHFLAYKGVRHDLWDFHTGSTFHHALGADIRMPRRNVDDNPRNDCSSGAHFASYDYVQSYYGGADSVVCVLKVDPQDVVVITSQKGRACRYVVVGLFERAAEHKLAKETVEQSFPIAPEEFEGEEQDGGEHDDFFRFEPDSDLEFDFEVGLDQSEP